MNGQEFYWAGTYSFKPEIKMFLEGMKHQIDEILKKIDNLDEATERK
ncbi:MAG: hypothetical protein MJ180_00645 [Candidatus Gastranaerophilales bacterium]|nr:hypothetical protein [Candidatus Gastranaerophilales bacterium]